MKIKVLTLVLSFSFFLCNFASAQHRWTEMGYLGGTVGLYSRDEVGYFTNVVGFFHHRLKHQHSSMMCTHTSDMGIIGTISLFGFSETDISATVQFSKGFWLSESILLQLAGGPSYSKSDSWGGASTIILSFPLNQRDSEINTAALFLSGDRYNWVRPEWRVSIGFSVGTAFINDINNTR